MSGQMRDKEIRTHFGRLVADARLECGESQGQFGERFGFDQRRVWRIETGRVPVTVALVEEIAAGIRQPAAYFLNPLVNAPTLNSREDNARLMPQRVRSTIEFAFSVETLGVNDRLARRDAKAIVKLLEPLEAPIVKDLRLLLERQVRGMQSEASEPMVTRRQGRKAASRGEGS